MPYKGDRGRGSTTREKPRDLPVIPKDVAEALLHPPTKER